MGAVGGESGGEGEEEREVDEAKEGGVDEVDEEETGAIEPPTSRATVPPKRSLWLDPNRSTYSMPPSPAKDPEVGAGGSRNELEGEARRRRKDVLLNLIWKGWGLRKKEGASRKSGGGEQSQQSEQPSNLSVKIPGLRFHFSYVALFAE